MAFKYSNHFDWSDKNYPFVPFIVNVETGKKVSLNVETYSVRMI